MPDLRPLILGEAPSKSGDRYWRYPLSGAVGERLARWAGLPPDPRGTRYGQWYWPLVGAFEPRNLLERYPGPQGRGAALPMGLAKPAWDELVPALRGRVTVLLGARLRALAGLPNEFGAWVSGSSLAGQPTRITAIPHPSGLNRAYNDPAAGAMSSRVLRAALIYAAGQQPCSSAHHDPPVPAVVRGTFTNPWTGASGPAAYCEGCQVRICSIRPSPRGSMFRPVGESDGIYRAT